MAYKIKNKNVSDVDKNLSMLLPRNTAWDLPNKKKKPSEYNSYLLPSLTDEDLDNYSKKADEYEQETKKYKITSLQRVELYHQIQDLGIKGHFVSLNNGFRVNKGKINYDIFYDEARDTYVVYKINNINFTDFTTKKFDDVYVEDLKEIIK